MIRASRYSANCFAIRCNFDSFDSTRLSMPVIHFEETRDTTKDNEYKRSINDRGSLTLWCV